MGKIRSMLVPGNTAYFSKTISEADIYSYAGISCDTNQLHLDEEYAKTTQFGKRIAHGMLPAGFISAVIGTKLPGPGTIYLGQTLKFRKPVFIGDTITAIVTVDDYNEERNIAYLDTVCENQEGELVIEGKAVVIPPLDEDGEEK